MIANLQGLPFMVGGATPIALSQERERKKLRERKAVDERMKGETTKNMNLLPSSSLESARAVSETHVFQT